MGGRVSKATWKASTEQEKRKGAGGSGVDLSDVEIASDVSILDKDKKKIYPSGKPLRLEERERFVKKVPTQKHDNGSLHVLGF